MRVTTKRRSTTVEKYTKKRRLEDLRSCIKICMHVLYTEKQMDDKEVCNATGLSLSTVYRVFNGQFSLAIRFSTVQAIAAAAGFKVELIKGTSTLAIVD